MRSKWLDWKPSVEIIEKAPDPEPSKPTKPGFEGFVGASPRHFPITRDSCPASVKLPVSNPYAERMQAALRKINRPDYPAGMIPWLDTVRGDLYRELTSHLPHEIHRLWSERAPLEEFEAVLARLVSLHRQCCDFYRAARTKPTGVPKTSPHNFGTPQSDRGPK